MMSVFSTIIKRYGGFFACLIFCAAILFVRLGSFGVFEPHEAARAEIVDRIENGDPVALFPLAIEERLAAVSTSIFGHSETALRLPSAVFALLAVILTYLLVSPFLGSGSAAMAALFLAGSPFWMFHGRQLTSAMPAVVAEIAALGGAMLAVFSDSKRRAIIGIVVALFGAGLGCATRGLIVGVAAPALAATFAALSCGCFSKQKGSLGRQGVIALTAGVVGIIAVGAFTATVIFSPNDIPLLTGKEAGAPISNHTFEFAFEQIVYGWFPLCALIPAAGSGLFQPSGVEPEGRAFARTLAVYALLTEYSAQVISLDVNGIRFASCALPMAILITLAAEDLLTAETPRRLDIFVAATLLAVLIRDFAQNNQTLLYGYGFDNFPIPKDDFRPVIQAGLFAVPTALLIVLGFFPYRLRKKPLSSLISICAPVSVAVFISFFLIPEMSVHLSSKHGSEMIEKYRTGNERVAAWSATKLSSDTTTLRSVRELADWLSKEERVFALFPPKELPAADRTLRELTGRQVFVLEKAGDRFMLAVSKPSQGEKNISPLKSIVQSQPFAPLPPHGTEINFNDSVTLLGWDLESEGDKTRLNRGQDFVFTSYWRVDGRIPGNYKMFMHFDGQGSRMHGDHELFNGNFPTSTWQKGDYIKEVFRMEVPVYQAKGDYTVRMGLYNDQGRLKILDQPQAQENSLLIAKTVIE